MSESADSRRRGFVGEADEATSLRIGGIVMNAVSAEGGHSVQSGLSAAFVVIVMFVDVGCHRYVYKDLNVISSVYLIDTTNILIT